MFDGWVGWIAILWHAESAAHVKIKNVKFNFQELLLYILTSIWVLRTSNTVWNLLFHVYCTFSQDFVGKLKKICCSSTQENWWKQVFRGVDAEKRKKEHRWWMTSWTIWCQLAKLCSFQLFLQFFIQILQKCANNVNTVDFIKRLLCVSPNTVQNIQQTMKSKLLGRCLSFVKFLTNCFGL